MPKIHYYKVDNDYKVINYGLRGKSAAYIAEKTDYTVGQVYTRLSKLGISLRTYRNEDNWVSRQMDRLFASDDATKRIKKEIQARIEENNVKLMG